MWQQCRWRAARSKNALARFVEENPPGSAGLGYAAALPIFPECLACGACCFSQLATYVRVTGDDHARLAERAEELVHFDGNRAYMRMTDGHCGALRIEPVSGRFFCSAYATRPDVCRNLARGSAECRGELHAKAERPVLALGRERRDLLSRRA